MSERIDARRNDTHQPDDGGSPEYARIGGSRRMQYTDGGDPGAVWAETGRSVFDHRNVAVHRLFVRDFVAEHQDRFLDEMAGWIRDGAVKYREDIREGLDQSPTAFSAMLAGGNFGKTLVRVSEDPTASPGTRILERGFWR